MTLVKQQIEKVFFPFVAKPGRYAGGEEFLPSLPPHPDLRVALAFPDLYELGMSYLGLRILWHLASQLPGIACERVFMPWFDAEKRLRDFGLPLFTLETQTPVKELDLLGFNLQYELHATNVLAMLDLGGIPLRAAQRAEDDPIILAGGPLAFHPEPFAPFFDAIAVGDGEELWPEILQTLQTEKKKGRHRPERIRALGRLRGVYLPAYYQPRFSRTGEYLGLDALDSNLPKIIEARITPQLWPEYYPTRPVVPLIEATHNRVIVEIARGCSRGCRFCGPGMTHRPVRERPIADLVNEIRNSLKATGYSQVSLLSLSSADYRRLDELLTALAPILEEHQASLSFPSLRPDRFNEQMADRAAAGSRAGLTLAPETATPRLRAVINKQTTDEDLLRAARLAFERNWKSLKLYFMVGLPTETDDDVLALVELVQRVASLGKEFGGRKLNVSISPFSPKPHTPFENEGQLPLSELKRRIGLLKSKLQRYPSVRLEIRDLHMTQVETAIARGDRRVADALEASYRAGGLFDAWTDGFSAARWEEAFGQSGLDLPTLTDALAEEACRPWQHIAPGISSEFLADEKASARQTEFTSDCRAAEGKCHLCGLQQHANLPCPEIPSLAPYLSSGSSALTSPQVYQRYRLIYRRTSASRYISHLDTLDILERSLRRLGKKIEFTQGMKPHPRLVASPPLPLGMTSQAEYLDFGLASEWGDELTGKLAAAMPPGFDVIKVIPAPIDGLSLGSLDVLLYRAEPLEPSAPQAFGAAIARLLESEQIPILRMGLRRARAFDARPAIWNLKAEAGGILIGLKSLGEAMPRAVDILGLIVEQPVETLAANWQVERLGMWWGIEGKYRSPMEATAPSAAATPLEGEYLPRLEL